MDEFSIVATPEQLSVIYKLAVEQLRLEKLIEEKEEELSQLTKDLYKVQQQALPQAIADAGLSEVKTANGDVITVKEDISVSVPKSKLKAIAEWLQKNNHGDIITGKVYVDLGHNSDDERQKAIEALVEAGLEPAEETNINTSTLKAILRDHLKKGEKIELSDFGGFAWSKAIIKRR